MQIHKIELENFKQYKNASIEFPEGLTGFIGKNGAGKSTIFEAVTNAFYGKLESAKEKIRNDKASEKEPVIIKMEFEDRGTRYKVTREYRGKNLTPKAQLLKEDNFVAEGTREVDKEIKKIVKIDYSNFKNSYFAHQKEVNSLLNLGRTDRQSSLRKMLGLEKIDKFEAKVKDFISEKKSEMRGSENELLPDVEIDSLKKSVEEKKAEIEKSKKEFEEHEKLVEGKNKEYKKIKDKNSELEKTKRDFDRISSGIEISSTKIKNNQSNLADNEKELAELKEAKLRCENLTPQKEKYEKVYKRIAELQELRAEYQKKINLENALKEKNEELLIKQKKIEEKALEVNSYADIEEKTEVLNKLKEANLETAESLNSALGKTNEILGSIKKDLKEKTKKLKDIEELGKDSDCPECERPLGDHYDKLTEKYESEIEELNKRNENQNEDLRKIKDQIAENQKKIDELNAEISGQAGRSRDLRNLEKAISEIKSETEIIRGEIKKREKEIEEIGKIIFSEEDLKKARDEESKLKPDYEECLRLETKAGEIPGKENKIKELNESGENEKQEFGKTKR